MSGRLRVLILMLADVLCMTLVWVVMVKGYQLVGLGHYHSSRYWRIWPALIVFVVQNSVFRLYHGNPFYPSLPLSPVEEFRRLFASSIFVHLLIMVVLGFRHEAEAISRVVLLLSAFGVALLAQPFRDLVRLLMFRLKFGLVPAMMVGRGATAEHVIHRLERDSHLGVRLVRYSGDNHQIVNFARERGIKLLIACQDSRVFREEMVELVSWFQYIAFMPEREVFPILGSRTLALGGFGGIELVNQRRIKGLALEKWVIDMALSGFITMLTLPLFLVIPVLIKLTSRGPVFYRARRLGKKGRPIFVWKFRSMYVDAERRLAEVLTADEAARHDWERRFKLRNDPRVTPLGRILRKTSIDELPQLVNVFRGEMSLVGPRPIVEDEKKYYGKDYEIFSLMKPGITGLWQVSGRSDVGYDERVALDKFYVLNWNVWMDLWIVLKTVAFAWIKGAR